MKKALFIGLLLGMSLFQVQAIKEDILNVDGLEEPGLKAYYEYVAYKGRKRKEKAIIYFLRKWAGGKGQTNKSAYLPNHSHADR